MNARFLAGGAIIGFLLAAALLTGQSAAQVGGEKGVFSTLKVGQMVELRQTPIGLVVTVYDDPAFKANMDLKIVEIGRDYIAVESAVLEGGVQTEVRYPVSSVAGVSHSRKKGESKTSTKKKPG